VFFSAKEVLFHEGEVGQEMFFLGNGQVDLIFTVAGMSKGQGVEHKFRRMSPGDYFGELPLLPSAKLKYDGSDEEEDEWGSLSTTGVTRRRMSDEEVDQCAKEHDHHLRLATGRAVGICDLFSFRKEALEQVLHTMHSRMHTPTHRSYTHALAHSSFIHACTYTCAPFIHACTHTYAPYTHALTRMPCTQVFDAFPMFEEELELEGAERRQCLIRVRHLVGRKAMEPLGTKDGDSASSAADPYRIHPTTTEGGCQELTSTEHEELKDYNAHVSMHWGKLSKKAHELGPTAKQTHGAHADPSNWDPTAMSRVNKKPPPVVMRPQPGSSVATPLVPISEGNVHSKEYSTMATPVREEVNVELASMAAQQAQHQRELRETKKGVQETQQEVRVMAGRVQSLEGKLDAVLVLLTEGKTHLKKFDVNPMI
jgi:CRP-like cAMP-binding protein